MERRTRGRGGLAALLIASSLLLALQTEAQEEAAPPALQVPAEPAQTHPTALETYLEEPGILHVTRRHRLPPIELQGGGKLRIDAVAAHEPGMQHQRMMGVRVEVDAPGLADEERVFYIDVHEIQELVRAIGFMIDTTEAGESAQGDDRTEMSVSTRDGLEVGVVFDAGGAENFLHTPSASFAVQRDTLTALSAALDEARKHLFSN